MANETVGMQNLVVPLTNIEANPNNYRKKFDEESLKELAASIKQQGLMAPMVVKHNPAGSKIPYQLVAGERRWRACKSLGLENVPVRIQPLDKTPAELDIAGLAENIARADLTTYEQAAAFADIIKRHKMSVAEVAKQVGRHATYVNRLVKPFAELHVQIKRAWENDHPVATVATLGRIVSKFEKGEEQLVAWQNMCEFGTFEAPTIDNDDDNDGDGDGGTNGVDDGKSGPTPFKVKPAQVLERFGYVNRSLKDDAKYEGAWVQAMLRYVVGKRVAPPEGIELPESKAKKSPTKPAKTRAARTA